MGEGQRSLLQLGLVVLHQSGQWKRGSDALSRFEDPAAWRDKEMGGGHMTLTLELNVT